MTYKQYKTYMQDYIDLGRSSERLLAELGFPPEAPDPDDYIKSISVIGAAADGDIKRLCELSGVSMAAFAAKYGVPYRTLQDWCRGERKPPEYLPALIGYAVVSELW